MRNVNNVFEYYSPSPQFCSGVVDGNAPASLRRRVGPVVTPVWPRMPPFAPLREREAHTDTQSPRRRKGGGKGLLARCGACIASIFHCCWVERSRTPQRNTESGANGKGLLLHYCPLVFLFSLFLVASLSLSLSLYTYVLFFPITNQAIVVIMFSQTLCIPARVGTLRVDHVSIPQWIQKKSGKKGGEKPES